MLPSYKPKVTRNAKYYRDQASILGYQRVHHIEESELPIQTIKDEGDLLPFQKERMATSRYQQMAAQQLDSKPDNSFFVTSIYPRIVKQAQEEEQSDSHAPLVHDATNSQSSTLVNDFEAARRLRASPSPAPQPRSARPRVLMLTPNQLQLQHQLRSRTPMRTQNQMDLLKLREKLMTNALESQAKL